MKYIAHRGVTKKLKMKGKERNVKCEKDATNTLTCRTFKNEKKQEREKKKPYEKNESCALIEATLFPGITTHYI